MPLPSPLRCFECTTRNRSSRKLTHYDSRHSILRLYHWSTAFQEAVITSQAAKAKHSGYQAFPEATLGHSAKGQPEPVPRYLVQVPHVLSRKNHHRPVTCVLSSFNPSSPHPVLPTLSNVASEALPRRPSPLSKLPFTDKGLIRQCHMTT